jgi:hypothetical protein
MRTLSQGMPVTPAERDMVEQIFNETRLKHMANPTPGVQATAAGAHGAESDLKALAARLRRTPGKEDVGNLLLATARDYANAWRSGLQSPNTRNAIAELDAAYPQFKAIQQAAKTTGAAATEGVPSAYSPAKLWQASRQVDRSVGKGVHNAGRAPQQELARLGQTIQNKRPDSGTAERLFVGSGILGAATPFGLTPEALAGAGGLALYGTKPMQDYLMGRLAPRSQEAIMQWLRSMAPLSGQAGAAIAND